MTNKTPDKINKEGTRFWLDKCTTDYAKQKGLKGIKVFIIEDRNGYQTRVITKGKKYLYEHQNLEAIGIRIDMLTLL